MTEKTSPKILIVDDDAHLRETLRDLLEMEGYSIYEAASGAEAMKMIASDFFEVILMDFNLTDRTGIEVIKDIRRLNQESQILMMTAHASLDTAVKAIQESVYDFLIKPVDFNYLKNIIARALEKLRLEESIKSLVAELKVKNEELTHLSEMKSKFLSMSSHDLSNTLMTLQISFDMLVGSITVPSEDQGKKIQFIKNGIEQISRLIGDLVDWASIEKGKFRLEKTVFDMGELVSGLAEGPSARAKSKGIALAVRVNGDKLDVSADKKRVSQVIMNLLENAIRHTARNGAVDIICKKDDEGAVLVSVKDSGDGIEADEVPKLFTSFYQGAEGSKQKGRLGLGLSIAKEIISAHNGRIWVESEGKGKGASFIFVLPPADSGA